MKTDRQKDHDQLKNLLGGLNKKEIIITETINTELKRAGVPSKSISNISSVVSHEDAEGGDVVICGYTYMSHYDDNVFTVCDYCGCEVVHRPSAPLSPPKACIKCASGILEISKELEMEFVEASKEFMERKNG